MKRAITTDKGQESGVPQRVKPVNGRWGVLVGCGREGSRTGPIRK